MICNLNFLFTSFFVIISKLVDVLIYRVEGDTKKETELIFFTLVLIIWPTRVDTLSSLTAI